MSRERRLNNRLDGVFSAFAGVSRDGQEPAPTPLDPETGAARVDPLGVVAGWSWQTDRRGIVTDCSPEVARLLGWTPEELIGQPLTHVAVPADGGARRELASALSGQRPLLDLRLTARHRDGRELGLTLSAMPFYDADGELAGYRGLSQLIWAPTPEAAAPPAPPPAASTPPPPALLPPRIGAADRVGPAWGYVAGADGRLSWRQWNTPGMEEALRAGRLVTGTASAALDAGEAEGQLAAGRRELAVPIRLQDQVIGVLDFVADGEAGGWSEDDLALAQAVSDQLALALENARLFSETRDYLTKQTLLYEVTRAAAAATTLGDALNGAAEALGRVLPDADVAILLLDEDGRTLRIRAAVGFPEDLGERLTLAVGEGITGWVAAHNQPVLIPDTRQDPRYVAGVEGMLSEAAIPLALGERVIGVLNVESPQAGAFDDDDLQLLSTLAGTLAAIIVNNNLLEEISRERERLGVLYDVLQSLVTRPDRDAIFETALKMAPRLGAEHGYVLLLGEREADAYFRATVPGLDRLSDRHANEFGLTIARKGLERWVLENRRPAVVTDTARDPRWYTAPGHHATEPARSVISAPLRTQRGAITGVLAYTHSLPGALGDEQLPLIESIAGQVAVALENEHLREQQRQQSYSSEALARAAQAMTRTLIESELRQIVLEQLFETFTPNGVALMNWDPGQNVLLPVAVRVASTEKPQDRRVWPAVGERIPAIRRPDLLEVLHNRHGRIAPLREEPDGQMRQSLAAPMLYGGEVEGVVELVHTGPARGLGPADLELLQSILTAAASALQSARLYELQRQTAERLAEVDRLKSQFLANMSHELRTPLNSIIGFSRVILKGIDGPLTDVQTQDLTSINNAGQHLLGLINDILDMARIEAGKMELVLDEVDLHETVRGVMSTARALVKEKDVKLIEDLPAELPKVRADSMRIRQVLLNLLSNAAKFTEEGAITLRGRVVEALGVHSGRPEPFVELSVSDTGPGIAPEDMGKLFEPFSQVDASATRKVGGTGLGLSICRQLVELHNGRIWAESEMGRGSTFIFIVPVGQPETPRLPQTSELRAAGGGRLILAVDDDPGLHTLYRRYLEPHGYKVMGVTHGADAVARAAELRPAAILLDVLMPGRDGWQVLSELKRTPITASIPVVMCTLVSDPDRARDLGAAGYLTKPILEFDLVRTVQRVATPVAVNGGRRKTGSLA